MSMGEWDYKLSAELSGHSLDVRGVAVGPEGCLLSASRDATAKLWHPQGARDFTNVQTYKGHTNFVSSVCFLAPCIAYPEGLVMTASNDKTICGYHVQESSPVLVLKGHDNTVCAVVPGRLPGTLLSASWDGTGRIWSADSPTSALLVLEGHSAVVWAIIELDNDLIATGSADKTIRIWAKDGSQLNSLSGHSDCVRGLALGRPGTFLSCANDASIKVWSNDGECLQTLFGHSNYIYSVCTNPFVDANCIVSCGEDSSIKVWSDGKNVCTISIPAQSVWCVTCMTNGDIVTGSSDGIVRVFTKDPTRRAEDAIIAYFEECVSKHVEASNQEIGGYKVTDLPGPEAILNPGKSDGQTKLVRFGSKVKCYSWSVVTQQWSEIGEVTGSAKPSEGKQMFEGKEYDFVFNVDIEDGKPAIKLPYNISEDPWTAAQSFIHKNFLPQAYLEQVANFIITNSKRGDSVAPSNNDYVDPFTGGTRYIPGTNGTSEQFRGVNADPFTGSSSYSTSSSAATPVNGKSAPTCFPQKSYLRFDQANVAVILNKLIEFNQKINDKSMNVSEDDMKAVIKLAEEKSAFDMNALTKLKIILGWPDNLLFPVLDITRLAIRNESVNAALFNKDDSFVINKLMDCLLGDSPPANQLLALRTLNNAFIHLEGEMAVLKNSERIMNTLICMQDLNKNLQVATSTLLLNLSIALGGHDPTLLCQCLLQILDKLNENEAEYRGFVALGTLIETAAKKSEITSIIVSHNNVSNKIKSYSNAQPMGADANKQKVIKCCKEIVQCL